MGERLTLKPRGRNVVSGASVFVIIALLWEFAPRVFNIPDFIIVPLSQVLATIGKEWQEGLGYATYITGYEMLCGILIALAFSLVISIVLSMSAALRQAMYPVLIVSQSIPIMVIAPIFAIALGYGLTPKIIVVAISCFFPITVNLLSGLISVDVEQINLMKTLYGSSLKIMTQLRIPAALPSLFAGLKVSVSYAPVAALFSEYTGSQGGLGYLMIQAIPQMNTALVWAEVLILALLSVLLFVIVSLMERLVCPWHAHT